MRIFSRLRRARRGQATVVGTLFFIIIALLFTRFLFDIYQIQSETIQQDILRSQERFEISSVFFGQLTTYTQPDFSPPIIQIGRGNPYTGLGSNASTGNTKPITNMNFTTDSEGWLFTRSYFGAGSKSRGASGFFDAGTIVSKFAFNPDPPTTAGAVMNWTTRFYLDIEDAGGASAITSANFVWTRKAEVYTVASGSTPATINVYFKDPRGVERLVDSVTVNRVDVNEITSSTNLDTAWIVGGGAGFYSLIISTEAELRRLGSETPEIKIYFDDVGMNIVNKAQISDWGVSLFIKERPKDVKDLKLSYTSHYNTSTRQTISLHDFSTNNLVKIDTSTISTTSVEITDKFNGGEATPYISPAGEIRLRIQSFKSTPFLSFADTLEVEIVGVGVTPDKIVITFANPGGLTAVVKRLWIIDSTGHFHFDDEIILTPGLSLTLTYTHRYAAGKITFRAITERGSIVTLTTTAP